MPGLEVKRVRKRAAIWLLALALLSSGQALAQAMETDEAGFAQCCRLLNWYPGEAWTLDGYQLADMNGDGVTDLVAVLRGQDGVSRRLVTAISTPEGSSLHENDRALPPESPQSPASEIDAQNGALVLRTRATGDTTRESTYTFVQNGDALVLGAMETVSWQEASGEAARECFDFSAGSYLQQSGLRNGSGFSVSETTAEYTFLPETLAFDAFDIASFPTTWDDFAGDAAVQPAQPTGTAAAAESDELAQDAPVVCPACGESFGDASAFAAHVCVVYPQTGRMYCDVCGGWYEEGEAFRMHGCQSQDAAPTPTPAVANTADAETAGQQILCEVCGQTFPEGEAFRSHVCVSRPPDGLVYCDVCGRYFEEGAAFRDHLCAP